MNRLCPICFFAFLSVLSFCTLPLPLLSEENNSGSPVNESKEPQSRRKRIDLNVNFDFPSTQALVTKQKVRLKSLKSEIKRRSAYHRYLLRKAYRRGNAGLVELRVCSLDLGGFGLQLDMKKLYGKVVASEYGTRLTAIKEALMANECQLVAIQGLIGTKYKNAVAGLSAIRDRLNANEPQSPWQSIVAETRARSSYVGFLYRNDAVDELGFKSYKDIILPGFLGFELPKFAVGPAELTLRVKKKLGDEPKTLELISFTFNTADYGVKISVKDSLQMAEALRRLYTNSRDSRNKKLFGDDVIVLLAGNTGSNYRSMVRRVIEGRVELDQFKEGGTCKVEEKRINKQTHLVPVCNNPQGNPLLMSGLTSSKPVLSKTLVRCSSRVKPDHDIITTVHGRPTSSSPSSFIKWCWREPSALQIKEMRKKKYKSTSDIFIRPKDLQFMRKSEDYGFGKLPLSSNSGYVEIRAGSFKTDLVRVDLNW